jgi:predicted negative regulator of RcsB-dependent stress response
VDKQEKEQLKHDVFVDEVAHGVQYAASHKKQMALYAGIAVGAVVLWLAWSSWSNKQSEERAADVREALTIQQAVVGPGANPTLRVYPTEAEKTAALRKSLGQMAAKYGSKGEGALANYYFGISFADEGNYAEAEKFWQKVIDGGDAEYGSLARYSLAQLYARQNKAQQAEQLLRYIVDHPTTMVSAENAKIELAKVLTPSKPDEAQKILEPLRQMTTRNAVSRWAISAYGDAKAGQK